ncbi:5'/3'-nucleotidase SurE [Mangrovitalea sediminis]|uniref:5'/3'-nucleotidase SurE n=1 Tax=Mangrovitalea sediminis TaxID=1982043 RepID=UPI000BE593D9|nr:5'/3'-nucleotidase SurE [Mangrovitalea sediminis]
MTQSSPNGKPIGRILITNDDGIRGEGLTILEDVARTLSDDVWVVAPESDQSGTSHSVSLHQPLRLYSSDDRHHAVSGTPSDCVLMAVEHLMRDRRPDLILSGINRGANLSDAVGYSGTVGAAMTGLLLGIPSIALSQAFRDGDAIQWSTSSQLAPPLLYELSRRGWPDDVCLNINFPDIPSHDVAGVRFCRPARGGISGVEVDARRDSRDQPYYWLGFRHAASDVKVPGSDVDTLRQGFVAISPLHFERSIDTHWAELAEDLSGTIRGQ